MLSVQLKDEDAALAILKPLFETVASSFLRYAKADPDLPSLHDDPRYKEMVATAEARLATAPGKEAVKTA